MIQSLLYSLMMSLLSILQQHSSFALVFGTWPVVMNKLPGGIHWVRLLFFNLFLLGIDSAFAFQEAFLTILQDTVYFENTDRWKLCIGLCVVGFLFSLMYCTDAGLYFLDGRPSVVKAF